MDGMAGQCLKGKRRDELGGGGGHHHPHFRAGGLQPAQQFGTFVGRNAAGDAQYHAFVGESPHAVPL